LSRLSGTVVLDVGWILNNETRKKLMKILFISGNLCDGGAQRVISVVASELAERGHDVRVLLFSRNEKEYPINAKVKIIAIRGSYAEYSTMSGLARVHWIRAYLKANKPDIAVGFLEGGYALHIASIGMRFPKIASARINPKVILESTGLRAVINRAWFRDADAVVLQTESQRAHVPDGLWKNMVVISNPVLDTALEYTEHNYNRPCRKIVMAGRLAEQKNYPMVFKALKIVLNDFPDVVLSVFGKGGLENSLNQKIRELGIDSCTMLRGWTHDTLSNYRDSDLYILSSNYEGMPNSLMEAMAMGLPCISTNCETGPFDLIDDGVNGFLVPVGDYEALADKIITVMKMSSESRRKVGESARRTMQEHFCSKVIVDKWETLLTTLVARRGV
jgi:GalNAc-alpha-(1->4)-GalNAc-alpha-(1->3)-diNAcBac-PP-undecaprenol alpha-1,4-N-acetyl-D-galactosaminyltransferase